MKVAIMQPYIFPYIGYFQLISAVDNFVFYDDVNYIKRGWINRNKILVNNQENLFTIPVLKASQNKLINEIELGIDAIWVENFITTLEQNYKKAPYYQNTISIIKSIFSKKHQTIADLAIASVVNISNYLEIKTSFKLSSKDFTLSKGMDKADRLIDICKKSGSENYINSPGGRELYNKEHFNEKGINLNFINSNSPQYPQFKNDFVNGLSIIDVLMFNSKENIIKMLILYQLN